MLEANIYSRQTISVTQLFTFWAKCTRNKGCGGQLKTIFPEIFLISYQVGVYWTLQSIFRVFKVKAHWKLWRFFNAIVRLQHIVKFCSWFDLLRVQTNYKVIYFSFSQTTKTWTQHIIHLEILKYLFCVEQSNQMFRKFSKTGSRVSAQFLAYFFQRKLY